MYIVCGYKMWFMTTPVVQQFGFYKSYEEAWFRLQTLLQTQNPISTGFSQSYGNQQFVFSNSSHPKPRPNVFLGAMTPVRSSKTDVP